MQNHLASSGTLFWFGWRGCWLVWGGDGWVRDSRTENKSFLIAV